MHSRLAVSIRSSSFGCSSSAQRDVEVIHALALGDVAHLGQRAEQRQAAVADVVAAGAVVDEADDLVAQLAVLQDAVGHQPAEIAGAGDQHALEADAGAPAPLEQLRARTRATRR